MAIGVILAIGFIVLTIAGIAISAAQFKNKHKTAGAVAAVFAVLMVLCLA